MRRPSPLGPCLALCLAVAAPVVGFTPPAAAQGMEDEATRQAEFARAELAAGEWDKALKSAESALKLSPSLYDAVLLKGLAYEGLGDLALAESLIVAYIELRSGLEPSAEATTGLERVRSKRAGTWIDPDQAAAQAAAEQAAAEQAAADEAAQQERRQQQRRSGTGRSNGEAAALQRNKPDVGVKRAPLPKPAMVVLGIGSGLLVAGGTASMIAAGAADDARQDWRNNGEKWGYPDAIVARETGRANNAFGGLLAGGIAGIGVGGAGLGVTIAFGSQNDTSTAGAETLLPEGTESPWSLAGEPAK